ncbi:MAG: flagellar basal body L-ring protein FlgH [Planctomycetaceae bacterium]|nr:flagellar basal body L-ring protein FlgH [Planctomycetaceae bacterium]
MKTLFPISFFIFHFSFVICYAQSGSLMGESVYGTEGGQPMTLRNGSFSYQAMPEPRMFKEQDLINVLVDRSLLYKNNSDLQRQRKIKGKMGLTEWVKFPGLGKLPEPVDTIPPMVAGEVDHQTRAKGQLTNSEKLTFKIQCRVTWKMDNGNLHIEGQDQQIIGEESLSIYFSGDIRPEDVRPDNTIPSNLVAFPIIKLIPAGNIFDSTKRNYGQRFIDRWSPF